MHGDSGGTISLGNGSSITSYTEGMKINNNGSIIIPSGDVSILKNSVVSGNLTISGTLQSFQTSLLATSSVMDGKVGTIIGVSIPQFLTRNETHYLLVSLILL